MNILDKFIELNIRRIIREARTIMNVPTEYSEFKKFIKKEHGIYFINFMALKDNKYTVMAKRKTYTYIYLYNTKTDELILKGERKNATT